MPFHHSQNSREFLARRFRTLEQSLDVAAQDRQWCAQFVRHVGDKIPPDLIQLLQLRDVVKQNECSADFTRVIPGRDGVEFDLRTVQRQLAANRFTAAERIGDRSFERSMANNLQQRCPCRNFR